MSSSPAHHLVFVYLREAASRLRAEGDRLWDKGEKTISNIHHDAAREMEKIRDEYQEQVSQQPEE